MRVLPTRYACRQERPPVQYILYCKENLICVLPEKKLCGLSPNFYIHVSVRDLYIPRISLHIFLQLNI